MLRITIHDEPVALTFKLEGSVAGPWVHVLEECWESVPARQRRRTLRVDLTGVTSIDNAGKACLASLHRDGTEFIAADCLTKAVVDEIRQAADRDSVHSTGKCERRPKRNRDST